MKILLVGGGGREDAIFRNLREHGHDVHVCMSNRNPSIISGAASYHIVKETDWNAVRDIAVKTKPDLVYVSPDGALDTPLVDSLMDSGLAVASPSRSAARIETSKEFMRSLLSRHGVEGNVWNATVSSRDELIYALGELNAEFVVKPLGLTGGKGVKVMGYHFPTAEEGITYASGIMEKEGKVLIEEKLSGEEFSLQAFCDGRHVFPMPLAQDYKRAFEDDRGPNTGGMGSITDSDHLLPFVTREQSERSLYILRKVSAAMEKEGFPFHGVLYGQFMNTSGGIRVVEINARFADPEGINVLSIMDDDLGEILMNVANGNLHRQPIFRRVSTVLKYIVPRGYGSSPAPSELSIESGVLGEGRKLFYASVSGTLDRVTMSTSRALAVVASAGSIPDASEIVDRGLKFIHGDFQVRRDIGSREMMRKKIASA